MARQAREMSVADLERLLVNRRSQLDELTRKREKLQKDLALVEQKIGILEGRQGRRGPAPGFKVRRKVLKRPRNERPLVAVVTDILSKSKKGLPLTALAEKVQATGYKSSSSNFNNVVYQCLYNADHIMHDPETGTWKLKQSPTADKTAKAS